MTQVRLNNLMTLHVYKEYTDSLDLVPTANKFVNDSKHRQSTFGKFTSLDRVSVGFRIKCNTRLKFDISTVHIIIVCVYKYILKIHCYCKLFQCKEHKLFSIIIMNNNYCENKISEPFVDALNARALQRRDSPLPHLP